MSMAAGDLVNVKKERSCFDAFCALFLTCPLEVLLIEASVRRFVEDHNNHCDLFTYSCQVCVCSVLESLGMPFKAFTEALIFINKTEGLVRLYKGLLPQLIKGFLVQGLMMLFKQG